MGRFSVAYRSLFGESPSKARRGTPTLFAVLNVLDGKVIGQCMSRHRHQEFIRFLNQINRQTPAAQEGATATSLNGLVASSAVAPPPTAVTKLDR